MKKTGRLLLAVAAVAMFTLIETGASFAQDRLLNMVEPVKAKKKYRIGYTSADMNADFFLALAYGIVDEAKQSGVELVRIQSAGGYGKVAEQIAGIEQMGALNLDAVIIMGAAFDGYDKVVDRLVAKGTKVVTLASPIGAPKVSFGVLQNEAAIGKMLADYVCKEKPKATVITLPGPAGVVWNKMRFDGLKAEAETCGLNLVGNTYAGGISIEDGQKQAGDMLLKYPDADYIYATAGIMAVGAAQQAKRTHAKAKVIAGTFTRRTPDMIKDGEIAMIVSEPPVVFGRAAIAYTVRLLNGDPMPNMVNGIMPYPVVLVPNTPVTAANLASYDVNKYDLPPQGWTPPSLQ
jgi:ribose transport system substrate-binding protein